MSPTRVTAAVVGVVVLILVGVLATRDSGDDRINTYLFGEAAPQIKAQTFEGELWDLDDQRGRWVVVNFFSTTCIPCIQEHPHLVNFAENHKQNDDVRIVTISFSDTEAAVEEFFRLNGGDWPVLTSETERVAVDWGVVAVPESYLVSPAGFVAAKVVGGVTQDYLEDLLQEARNR